MDRFGHHAETMDGCIGLSTQDSMRLYVDDKLLIDGWGKDKSADQALDFHFEAGRTYKIRIEFVNDRRGARVIFGYSAGWENFPAAVEAARKADVAILCMGDNEETSGENFDRTDLNLPADSLSWYRLFMQPEPLWCWCCKADAPLRQIGK